MVLNSMPAWWLAIAIGLALLVWGADRFVVGAAGLARNLGVSTLVIGLTVVGFATSAPEMLVSATAALQGNPELAIGNALGSNVANIGLVLGITALVLPLSMSSGTLRRELPILLIITAGAVVLLLDQHVSRLDALILIGTLVLVLAWLVRVAHTPANDDPMSSEMESEIPPPGATSGFVGWLILGFVVLLLGSKALVWGAVNIASAWGVSDLVIGLTIVAIGTSLPELAASVAGVLKGEADLAIGNVIGSNLFNLLAVIGVAGAIHPFAIQSVVLTRDYPMMAAMTALLAILVYNRISRRGHISRLEGGLLLGIYGGYMAWLYASSI